MQTVKRLIEDYLGIPPSDPGQGTAWNFLWHSPWPGWLPPWGVLLLIAAAVVYVAGIYRRDAATVPLGTRIGLTALRLAIVAMAFFFLSEMRLSVDRTGLPTVAVLIDDSLSMGFEDEYDDPQNQATARRLLSEADLSKPTRLNLAKALLLRDDGELLKDLLTRHRLRVYRFSDGASVLGTQEEALGAEDVAELLPLIAGLKAEGDATRPGPAVQKVLDDLRGAPPSAVIVLSDGITSSTEADSLTAVADLARSRLVPIITVALGTEEPARDAQVYGLLGEDVAFVGDPLTFSAKLKTYGLEGERVEVVLRRKDTGEEVGRQTVNAGRDGRAEKVEIVWTPQEKGEYEFIAEATVRQGETNPHNNATQPQLVSVRQEPIRVLLADSVPRWEFRYLKHTLEREAFRKQGANTLEFHTVLQDADLDYAREDRTALEHFPVKREELFRYDVVILGDVDPKTLSPAVLENLREFVGDAGGGLIMIAGPQHNPLSYVNTPLEAVLPIELNGAELPPEGQPITQGFEPELTIEGRTSNAVFRFGDTEAESLAVWNDLPELYWFVRTPNTKPGALTFVQHPYRSGSSGNLPIITVQQYGAGKVLFHATDELWRWRFRHGDLYPARYWMQAIRYLTRSRLLGRDRGARLTSDREQYQRGDTVTLRLRFLDERLAPTGRDGVTVMLERHGDQRRQVRLTRLPQAANVFEGQLQDLEDGSYHAWVVEPSFQEAPPTDDFLVESQSAELTRRNIDTAELVQAAKVTGGRHLDLAGALKLARVVPPGQPVALESQEPILLWNRWEFLLLFTILLTAEWLWRKRLRLV